MALADVYDALISVRPYKLPMTSGKALEIMASESGRHFDPMLTDIFVSCISSSGV
jgi:putative two-component system response regulator